LKNQSSRGGDAGGDITETRKRPDPPASLHDLKPPPFRPPATSPPSPSGARWSPVRPPARQVHGAKFPPVWSPPLSKSDRSYGPNHDARFALHQRQPRADKLDARQRTICHADPAYAEALRQRVSNEGRFAAFMAGVPSYIDINGLCPRCGNFRRRTRDRSCYACHLNRSGENFERIKAGIAPVVTRNLDSHLDLLARQKGEREDDHQARQFGDITAKWWPTGKLEVTFGDGYTEPDFTKLTWHECMRALEMYPGLRDVLRWAGWSVD